MHPVYTNTIMCKSSYTTSLTARDTVGEGQRVVNVMSPGVSVEGGADLQSSFQCIAKGYCNYTRKIMPYRRGVGEAYARDEGLSRFYSTFWRFRCSSGVTRVTRSSSFCSTASLLLLYCSVISPRLTSVSLSIATCALCVLPACCEETVRSRDKASPERCDTPMPRML